MTVPTFVFDPHIQKLINDGLYELVKHKETGQILGIVRDKATGQFAGVAKAIVEGGVQVNPLFTPLNIGTNLVTSTAQMYQNHRGFQQTYSMIRELKKALVSYKEQ